MPVTAAWKKTTLIGLIGNPNAGKTSIFNALTGGDGKVGNYPGVTVEKLSGRFHIDDVEVEIVDIPGLYTLTPMSMDEVIATEAIKGTGDNERRADVMLIALDATNLERNLFFFSQVIELGIPMIAVLTMSDIVKRKGIEVDLVALEKLLGVPVVPVVSHKSHGISRLKMVLKGVIEKGQEPSTLTFDSVDSRYAWAETVHAATFKENPALKLRARQDKIDFWLTHRVFGLIFFLLVMYGMFQSVYTLAGPIMDVIEFGFSWVGDFVGGALAPIPWLQSLVVDGIIAGIGGVAIFLPQILILFGFVAILEGSGYLARASFLMDKSLGWCGLNGKAFIPLLSSFACAIPGIMAARIMPDAKSRLVTILVAPLMSCSARLPVYILLIGAIIEPRYGPWVAGLTLFGMHAIGAIISIPIIFILNRKVLRGKQLPFLMELPPYQFPKWKEVGRAMFGRAKVFLQTAGTIIIVMSVIIWGLLYFPRSDAADRLYEQELYRSPAGVELYSKFSATGAEKLDGHTDIPLPDDEESRQKVVSTFENFVDARRLEDSYLGRFGKFIEPVFVPAGFDWRISTAILAAFPAREVLVSSLGIIFDLGGDQDEESTDLRGAIKNAKWPDGRPLMTTGTAFALMIFFALCCQCGATLATIRRETNSWKWPTFVFFYMTGLAWVCAVIVNQASRAMGG